MIAPDTVERIDDAYALGDIEPGEARAQLRRAGIDPAEIDDHLWALDEMRARRPAYVVQIWIDGWRDFVTKIKSRADADRIADALRGHFICGLKFRPVTRIGHDEIAF
jgi:hypothetical protein